MASRHSNHAGTKIPENSDDLKLIHGIGKAIETHIHAAGIHTYSQLAVLTPEELAGLILNVAGVTPEKIASMDWIGQAGRLASQKENFKRAAISSATEERQHYSTFTVELLLDRGNKIRRTRVVHVQTGNESAWAGWIPSQLENLIINQIALSPRMNGIAHSQKAETAQTGKDILPAGQIRLQEVLAVKEETRTVTQMLRYGQPYSLQIILDVEDVATSGDIPVHYEAIAYARDLGRQCRETIGAVSGTSQLSKTRTIHMPGQHLNRGMYRLEAVVAFSSRDDTLPKTAFNSMVEGNLLQVY